MFGEIRRTLCIRPGKPGPSPKSSQPAVSQQGTLDHIWTDVQDAGTTTAYPLEDRLSAFSLTFCAGLPTYDSAEENLAQYRDNLAAYWRLKG